MSVCVSCGKPTVTSIGFSGSSDWHEIALGILGVDRDRASSIVETGEIDGTAFYAACEVCSPEGMQPGDTDDPPTYSEAWEQTL